MPPEAKPKIKTVWDVGLEEGTTSLPSVRLLDFAAFACLPITQIDLGGLGPLNAAAALVLAGACLFRRPASALRTPLWVVALLGLFLTYFFANSLLLDVVNTKRMIRLISWALILIFLGTGHVDIRSAAKGLATSMSLGLIHAIATLPASSYPGRLTGLLGDPNTVGLECVTFGALGVLGIASKRLRHAYIALLAAGVFLTFSRTTLLAVGVVLAWTVVGRRVGLVAGYGLIGGLMAGIASIPPERAVFGPFEGRSGSDALRGRIQSQSTALVESSPIRGHGLGTAMVQVQQQQFFFHNSYLALACEGGWIAVGLYGLFAMTVFTALLRLPRALRNPWVEVAMIGVALCAINLGEVLLTFDAAVTLGFAIRIYLQGSAALAREKEAIT